MSHPHRSVTFCQASALTRWGPGRPDRCRAARGVTLVELLVALALGMMAVALISGVVLTWEGRKRTTIAGSDAQVNAALALDTIKRDLQMSGFGLTTTGAAGCTIKLQRNGTTVPDLTLTPVLIERATSGGPVALTVMMSGKSNFAMPVRVAEDHRRDATTFLVLARTHLGTAVGDLMLAVPSTTSSSQVSPNWCSVFSISALSDTQISHEAGADQPWNQDLSTTVFPGTVTTDISYAAGSALINLGTPAQFLVRRYSLGNGELRQQMLDMSTGAMTSPETLFPHVVDLQAVYGKDTNADGTVDTWDDVTPTTATAWNQVIAVRVALVTRSEQYEGKPGQTDTAVTLQEPTWTPDGSTAIALSISQRVSCPAGETDCWTHYRYRVFETVVPLRNMLWRS